ncbi:LacI family DNA-binding transcriptional regulator [Sinomicrobium sp. M5D2P17]
MENDKEKQLVGVKEIARRANVSTATVDRVLNNRSGVSAKTKERILEIVRELDYKPNIMARRLASRKTLAFAVLIPEISEETEYWDAPLNGVKQAAGEIKDFGVTVDLYFFNQNEKTSFVRQSEEILNGEYQGVILAPMFEEESIAFIRQCEEAVIPFVFINSDIEGQNNLCYIGPDLFQSGYLAGHLMHYMLKEGQRVLVVNISKEMDLHHHLLRKEEGLRACFQATDKGITLFKTDIRKTDYSSIKNELTQRLSGNSVDVIFVTNSRVSSVARFLEETGRQDITLIGYDFLRENIRYLQKGTVDFLICQKPQEQGYRGVMALYDVLVHQHTLPREQYMPIDIVTRENYKYYQN